MKPISTNQRKRSLFFLVTSSNILKRPSLAYLLGRSFAQELQVAFLHLQELLSFCSSFCLSVFNVKKEEILSRCEGLHVWEEGCRFFWFQVSGFPKVAVFGGHCCQKELLGEIVHNQTVAWGLRRFPSHLVVMARYQTSLTPKAPSRYFHALNHHPTRKTNYRIDTKHPKAV